MTSPSGIVSKPRGGGLGKPKDSKSLCLNIFVFLQWSQVKVRIPQHFRFPDALRKPIEIGIDRALSNAETAQFLDNTNLLRGRDAPEVERL